MSSKIISYLFYQYMTWVSLFNVLIFCLFVFTILCMIGFHFTNGLVIVGCVHVIFVIYLFLIRGVFIILVVVPFLVYGAVLLLIQILLFKEYRKIMENEYNW